VNHDDNLKRKLNTLEVPEELEKHIRSNWQTQMQTNTKRTQWWRPGLALVASFSLAFFVSIQILKTPAFVDAAAYDIISDVKHNIGLSIPLETILAIHDMQLPPASMPVKMTKLCTIDGLKTTHIQVNGKAKGEVHLFIKQGEFDTAFWQAQQGEVVTMPWKLIKSGKNLSILVLYSADMDPDNVETMIQKMFYT